MFHWPSNAAGGARAFFVDRLECSRQEQHGNIGELWVLLHKLRDLVPVTLRHAAISQHDIWTIRRNAGNSLLAITNRHHMHIFVSKRELDDALDRDTVIR